ncbi:MAG: ammonium transporter [Candidatus Methylacidiphilales bacterium]|nr:ammonium transporter [Candidatus Methylacidiphilales bacterium]
MTALKTSKILGAVALASLALALPAFAQDAAAPAADAAAAATEAVAEVAAATVDKGDTTWMLISTILVIAMTIPGLALFYGGLVRAKNMLSVLMQVLAGFSMIALLWVIYGYSLAFNGPTEGGLSAFIGDFSKLFLSGVTPSTTSATFSAGVEIPELTFVIFQLTFAAITPALIIGAIAERMKFAAVLTFVGFWMFLVYFPLAHMVWGFDGLMNGVWNSAAAIPAIDFAGGTVVHMSSGWSALVLAIMLGKRKGHGTEKMAPHSMVLCMVGTGMLWVGWYGFNAGSALAADGIASQAFMTTTLAAAVGGFVWALAESFHKGKASVLGFCSGIVAGLVVITPACGFVTAKGAMIIGVLAGLVPYAAVVFLKPILKVDDALDTFGVHGVGGTLGAILTGLLATKDVNANLVSEVYAVPNGLAKLVTEGGLVVAQLKACGLTIILSVVATVIIGLLIKFTIGLRPSEEVEASGLDINEHGEEGYVAN